MLHSSSLQISSNQVDMQPPNGLVVDSWFVFVFFNCLSVRPACLVLYYWMWTRCLKIYFLHLLTWFLFLVAWHFLKVFWEFSPLVREFISSYFQHYVGLPVLQLCLQEEQPKHQLKHHLVLFLQEVPGKLMQMGSFLPRLVLMTLQVLG